MARSTSAEAQVLQPLPGNNSIDLVQLHEAHNEKMQMVTKSSKEREERLAQELQLATQNAAKERSRYEETSAAEKEKIEKMKSQIAALEGELARDQ
jgi:hypothetical protein